MNEEIETLFNSSYGPAHLTEVVTDLKIEGAGKYTFVQMSDSHIAVLSEDDSEDMRNLIIHERNVQWGGGCLMLDDRRTDLTECNEIMREKADSLNPDVVFITGDVADVKTEGIFREVLGYKERFKSPVYFIAGNHDEMDIGSEGSEEMHRLNAEIFGEDRLYKEIHFNGFDVVCISTFQYTMSDKLVNYLTEKLKGDKPIILFLHAPIYTEQLRADTGDGFIDYFTVGAEMHSDKSKEFARLVKENTDKIVAVFAGHCHYHLDNDAKLTEFKQYINNTAFSGFYRIININH